MTLMDFLAEYGMFLAKFGTVVMVVVAVAFVVFLLYLRTRAAGDEHLEIKHLNQKYEQMELMLKSTILPKKEFKRVEKDVKAKRRLEEKQAVEETGRGRIFVLEFEGDVRASDVASLREEITSVLTVAGANDEVFVILESDGGTVHGYGLAASQLKRITSRGVRLTVAVDKVAASGGYMMACVADTIIAAPFAVIGSIGVLAQLPNFHRFLKKHDIDFEQFAAGKYKRTISLFGENTQEDRDKLRQELEETHELFKDFVRANRAQVDIEKIATGEHWYGTQALELGLVDELLTSDDYLAAAAGRADIYQVTYMRRKPFTEKLFYPLARLFGQDSL